MPCPVLFPGLELLPVPATRLKKMSIGKVCDARSTVTLARQRHAPSLQSIFQPLRSVLGYFRLPGISEGCFFCFSQLLSKRWHVPLNALLVGGFREDIPQPLTKAV